MNKSRKCFARILLGLLLMVGIFCGMTSQAHAMKKTLTGYKTIDYIAEKMVRKAGVKDGMSTDKKIKKIYHYMTKNFKHVRGKKKHMKIYYNTKKMKKEINAYYKQMNALEKAGKIKFNKKYKNMLWHMLRRAGDCTHIAAMFEILCKHVGVSAGVCRGHYLNRNGTAPVHSWNWARVDGKKYYYDVDVELKNNGRGQGDYYWYKKTYKQARRNHRFH